MFSSGRVVVAMALLGAGLSPADTTSASDDTFDLGAVREGLHQFNLLNDHVASAEQMTGCPALGTDELVTAIAPESFEHQLLGVRFQFEEDRYGDHGDTRGVDCIGIVGPAGEFAPPTAEVVVSIADLGDEATADDFLVAEGVDFADPIASPGLAGDTFGSCDALDPRPACSEWWSSDGIVVGVTVTGDAGEGRTTAAATLDRVGPSVLDTIAGWAIKRAPDVELSTAQLAQAAATIPTIVTNQEPGATLDPTNLPACPAIDRDVMVETLATAELPPLVDDWVLISTDDEPTPPRRSTVLCAGDADERTVVPLPGFGPGAVMSVVGFESLAAATEYIDSNDLVVTAEQLPVSGHLILGSCFGVGEQLQTCDGRWWQDGVMVSLSLTGDPSTVDLDRTETALLDAVPDVIESLGD